MFFSLRFPRGWQLLPMAAAMAAPGLLFAKTSLVPSAPQWHPNEILQWNPATDPAAPYERSVVPLAPRFATPTATQNAGLNALWNVNPHARPGEGRVQAVTTFNTIPVGGSQGWRTTRLGAPTMWPYMEDLVFWGSSDRDTRTILTPTAHVIDAAHRNGVRIYGKIFFGWNASPDDATLQRVRDLLKKTGGTFPVADKLIQAAVYLGFDGYFINQENYQTTASDAQNMRDFIVYFRAKAAASNASHLRIVWYDSMAEDGQRYNQNAFTSNNDGFMKSGPLVTDAGNQLVAQEMFLNFWWYYDDSALFDSRARALSLGLDPYDIYAGIWTENYRRYGVTPDPNGSNEIEIPWDSLFPENRPHNTSVALFGSETPFFKSSSPATALAQDEIYWCGQNHDPSNTAIPANSTLTNWPGIAHYIPTSSAIASLPFATNFNVGQGNFYRIDGISYFTGAWTNLSVQDQLPTWRWIVQSNGAKTLVPTLDFADAYWGGSSLLVTGALTANVAQDLKLYQANLLVSATPASPTFASIVFKPAAAGPSRIQVGFAFQDNPGAFQYVDVDADSSIFASTWNTRRFNLTNLFPGRRIVAIGLRFLSPAANAGYSTRIGRLTLYDTTNADGTPVAPVAPTNVVVEASQADPDDATSTQLRVKWTASPSPVFCYNVYSVSPAGGTRWLGATANTYFYAPTATPTGGETTAKLKVEAVGADFGVSSSMDGSFEYAPAPVLSRRLTGTVIGTIGAWDGVSTREKVFDRSFTTFFDSRDADGDTAWAGLDLGGAQTVTALRFYPRSNYPDRMVGGLFQGANTADFSDAVTFYTIVTTPKDNAYGTIAVDDSRLYRYVRYLSPKGGHGNVAEVEFYGTPAPTPSPTPAATPTPSPTPLPTPTATPVPTPTATPLPTPTPEPTATPEPTPGPTTTPEATPTATPTATTSPAPTPTPLPAPPAPPKILGKIPTRTHAARLTMHGTVTKPATYAEYRVGVTGPFVKAAGGARWKFLASLKVGRNTIFVRAVNPGSRQRSKEIRVIVTRN